MPHLSKGAYIPHFSKNLLLLLKVLAASWFSDFYRFFADLKPRGITKSLSQKKQSEKKIPNINSENYIDMLRQEEEAWYTASERYYHGTLPSHFFVCPLDGTYYETEGVFNIEQIFDADVRQLPKLVNSCREYIVAKGKVEKSRYLRFHNGKKVYFPDNAPHELLRYADAYEAAKVELPVFDDGIQALEDYYRNVWSKMDGFENRGSKSIFYYRICQLYNLIIEWVNFYYNNNELSSLYKSIILARIKKCFCESETLERSLSKHIESLTNQLPSASLNLSHEINDLLQLQEQAKLKLRLKEMEVRAEEQKKIFSTINHDIKSTCGTVISSLDLLSSQSFTDEQNKLWKSAYIGAAFINSTATAISMSYRSNKDWNSDFESSDPADTNFKDIIYNAFTLVVPNMFVRDYSMYKNESEKYFPDKNIFSCATQEWFAGEIFEDREKWLNKYFGNFQLKFDASCNELKIGNKHGVVIHLFILFKELFLNAIKAAAWVDKEKRQFYFDFSIVDKILHIDIKNSSRTGIEKKEGLGLLIFNNYKEMFSIQNNISHFDNGVFFQHFEIPYGNSK